MTGAAAILAILAGLQVKHFLGDFVLQTPYILNNRWRYGHPGGLLHSAIHVALSAVVLAVAGTPGGVLVALLLFEAVVHYHTDWAKDNFTRSRELTPARHAYWMAMGADQALHQVTYLAMVWYWALAVAA